MTFYWILYRKLENENNLTKNSSSRIVCLALRIKKKTELRKQTNIFSQKRKWRNQQIYLARKSLEDPLHGGVVVEDDERDHFFLGDFN